MHLFLGTLLKRKTALLLALAVYLFSTSSVGIAMPDRSEQTKLEAELLKVLDKTWKITATKSGVTPSDWWTNSAADGFLFELSNGKNQAKVYFLPLDWIGIRKKQNEKAPHYTEGVLWGDKYKLIAEGVDQKFVDDLYNLFNRSFSTSSLVNSGFMRSQQVFKGKESLAEKMAAQLVSEHCKTPDDLNEAAHSLIVLGVPAKSVFVKAVSETKNDRTFLISSLGYFDDKACVNALCHVLISPGFTDHERYYATMALRSHYDESIYHALLQSLKNCNDPEALSGILKELSKFRNSAACAEIMNAYKRMNNNRYYQQTAIQTMAACNCREAIPILQEMTAQYKLIAEKQKKASGPQINIASVSAMPGGIPSQASELALLRLTADWGKSGKNLRLFLLPPNDAQKGKKIILTIYVENIGKTELPSWSYPVGLKLDGKPLNIMDMGGRSYQIEPGAVHAIYWELTRDIKSKGKHTVEYSVDDASAKPVSFEVK